MTGDLVGEVGFLYGDYPGGGGFLYAAAFGVVEEYCARAVVEAALESPGGGSAFLLAGYGRVLLAVHVDAVVQLLVVHPDALEGFLAVGAAEGDRCLHTLALNQLYLRVDLNHILPGLDPLLILDD